jgi:hypothetical protein
MAEGGDEFPHPELSQEDLTQADKEWTLEHCKMDILDHRKKTNENFMTLVLQFKFDYDPEPKIVGKIFHYEPVSIPAPSAADFLS